MPPGWTVAGDMQIHGNGNVNATAAQFSYLKGNRLENTIIAATQGINGLPYGLRVDAPADESNNWDFKSVVVNGNSAINGYQNFYTNNRNQHPVGSGRWIYQSFYDNTATQLGYIEDEFGNFHIAGTTSSGVIIENTGGGYIQLQTAATSYVTSSLPFYAGNFVVAADNGNPDWTSVGLNHQVTDAAHIGFVANATGADKNLYIDVPTSGAYNFRVNVVTVASIGTTGNITATALKMAAYVSCTAAFDASGNLGCSTGVTTVTPPIGLAISTSLAKRGAAPPDRSRCTQPGWGFYEDGKGGFCDAEHVYHTKI
jgi:hypothetical protein